VSLYTRYAKPQVAAHQTEGYTIQTDLYAGPLDLLLELIERAELDITRLALAEVTDQYLAYMRLLGDRDAAEVSAFLVIAARLLQIKSAALLPRPPAIEPGLDEADTAEALAQQLIIYRRFKQLAWWLEARQNAGLRTYLRIAAPAFKVEAKLDLTGVTLHDLTRAAWQILANKNALPFLSEVVNMPRITIRDRIKTILARLREGGAPTFRHLLQSRNRLEVVVTFLAMLELIKQHVIDADQDHLFSEIQLKASGELEDLSDIELDFTE
jgi:segregation and condensation protein A